MMNDDDAWICFRLPSPVYHLNPLNEHGVVRIHLPACLLLLVLTRAVAVAAAVAPVECILCLNVYYCCKSKT